MDIKQYFGADTLAVKAASGLSWDSQVTKDMNPTAPIKEKVQNAPTMVITYAATPGFSKDNSITTSAARALYAYVRHANSGSKNYDSIDLFLVQRAVAEFYVAIFEAIRVLGAFNTYSSSNSFYGKFLVERLGWSFSDLQDNIAEFKKLIYNYLDKSRSFNLVSIFPAINMELELNSRVYSDADSVKAQLYMFKREFYLYYNQTVSTGGALIPTPCVRTVAGWTTLLNKLYDALSSSEDVGIMSGDLLKAFGPKAMVDMKNVDLKDCKLQVSHDEDVLLGIMNSNALPREVTDNLYTADQTYGETTYENGFALAKLFTWGQLNGEINLGLFKDNVVGIGYGTPAVALDKYKDHKLFTYSDRPINTYNPNPTDDDVIKATRFMICGSISGAATSETALFQYNFSLSSCSNIVILDYRIYDVSVGTDVVIKDGIYFPIDNEQYDLGSPYGVSKDLELLSRFNYFPTTQLLRDERSDYDRRPSILMQSEIYTNISVANLNSLNTAILNYMWGVPYLGIGDYTPRNFSFNSKQNGRGKNSKSEEK